MIVEPDEQSYTDLKEILDCYKILDFRGSYMTFGAAKKSIREEPPDIAFVRMGKTELNAYETIREIRERNLFTRVILLSEHEEYAVEAFDCEADGFIFIPYNEEKIKKLILRIIERRGEFRL
jgi:two-component system response regulator AlgR